MTNRERVFHLLVVLGLLSTPVLAQKVFLPIGNTTAIPVAGVDASNNPVMLKVDGSGNLSVADAASGGTQPTVYTNLGASAAANVKASSGSVFSISASNANASSRFLLIHNKASAPVATDVPVQAFLLPTNSQLIVGTDFFTNIGVLYSSGIGVCFSTTRATCTPASAADTTIFVNYN